MNADELSRIAMSASLSDSLSRAVELARSQGHLEVTLEHMLVSLCEDPDARLVLAASNIDVARLKSETWGYLSGLQLRAAPGETVNPSVAHDLRRIMEAAAAAARGGRRREINGAIVLAAIVGDGRSAAARLLQAQGLTFDGAIRALQGAAAPRPRPNTEEILASARERVQSRAASARKAEEEAAAQEPAPSPATDGGAATANKPRETARPLEKPAGGASEVAARPEPTPPKAPEPSITTAPPVSMPAPPPPPPAPPAPAPASSTTDDALLPSAPEPTRSPPPAAPSGPPPIPASEPAPLPIERAAPPPFEVDAAPEPPAAPIPPAAPAPAAPPPAAAHPAVPPPLPPMRTLPDAPRPGRVGGEAPGPVPPARSRWPDLGEPGARPRGVGAGGDGGPSPLKSILASRSAPATAPPPPQPMARPNPAQRPEIGQLVENIPRIMRVAVPALVEVRIAKANVQALAEGLQGGGAAYRHEVTITKAMSVRLRAPDGGFFIETASPETQWIEKSKLLSADEYASWRWHITPREKGRKRLQLIISARTVSTDGLAAETALPDQVITVRVRTNYAKSASHLVGWGVAALIGGLLARFGEGAYDAGMQIVSKLTSG